VHGSGSGPIQVSINRKVLCLILYRLESTVLVQFIYFMENDAKTLRLSTKNGKNTAFPAGS
jgi:hypothetical protein